MMGYFLSYLLRGTQCIGIEPAANMVNYANERQVRSVNAFVSEQSVGKQLRLWESKRYSC